MVPGRKFCTSTSACATSLARTSRPISLLISIDSERLPRFEEMNSAENSPALSMVARLRRVISPPIGSILSTSAPWSARNMVANGPDTTPVKSSTRTPLSGPDMTLPLCCLAGGRYLLGDLGPDGCRLLDDRFFYITQLILAKEHFLTDEECRRAKGPAIDRVGSVFDQLFLDVVLLRAGNQPVDADAG